MDGVGGGFATERLRQPFGIYTKNTKNELKLLKKSAFVSASCLPILMRSIENLTESFSAFSKKTLALNQFLQVDPSDPKVYTGPPYPLGIDPVQTRSFLITVRLLSVLMNGHRQCSDCSL